ncbi:MAG: ABC transporter substrate-binding protein [Actinomycetes bacterium]
MRLSALSLILTLALGIVAVPLAAAAQQATKVYRIGRLVFDRADSQRGQYYREVFRQGLREFGWVEGQNITIEWRSAEERVERFPDLAAELVRLQVDIIVVSGGGQMLRTIKEATTTIPIVIISPDPVGDGLVASLAQPGGNITGVSIMATEGGRKRLELLKEAVPQAAHVAVLWNAANRFKALEWQETQDAAQVVGVALHSVEVRGPDDFDGAFATIAREHPDALLTFGDFLTSAYQRRIVDFAIQHRLPLISESKEFVGAGGLMTYGASLPALTRRTAYYVDRILKGTKPADLPVEQPTTFELVINLKTAQALGITIPPTLLFQADEVIR